MDEQDYDETLDVEVRAELDAMLEGRSLQHGTEHMDFPQGHEIIVHRILKAIATVMSRRAGQQNTDVTSIAH